MHIFLSGGSGDLGQLLTRDLTPSHTIRNLDIATPPVKNSDNYHHIQGSITDKDSVEDTMQSCDHVIHIAAWHGIHEDVKSADAFFNLNVIGTYNMLEAARKNGVKRFIFISSTSVKDRYGLYGHTKVLGEEMVHAYAARHTDMEFVILRPRAFIPPWNKGAYSKFSDFFNWFVPGAVHIEDFAQAVIKALDVPVKACEAATYIIDGAYDYSDDDLKNFNNDVVEKHYGDYLGLAKQYGIDLYIKPNKLTIDRANRLAGYNPEYSLKTMLEQLKRYGNEGPPSPF